MGQRGWLWIALAFGGLGFLWSGVLTLASLVIERWGNRLMGTFVDSHNQSEDAPMTLFLRYGYLGALVGVQLAKKLALNKSVEISSAIAYMLRAGIMTTVYERILASKLACSIGGGLNRLAIDSNRIATLMLFGHLTWSCPLRLLIAFITVYERMGLSSLAGIAFILFIQMGLFVLAHLMRRARRRVAVPADERLQLTSKVLCSLRTVKSLAMEESLLARILYLRDRELRGIGHVNMLCSVASSLNFWSPVFATTLTVVFATLREEEMDPGRAFVAVRAFRSLTGPLWMMPSLVNRCVAASVSAGRLDQILRSSASPEAIADAPDEAGEEDQRPAMILENASFVDDQERIILERLNVRIEGPGLFAVSGPMSAGKTALISALAEMLHLQPGGVYSHPSSIGYCPFPGWLHSGSVQENVLFGRPLDPLWYEAVMRACKLQGEVDDARAVGEDGCLLSGGQRQRVALARAVYARPALLLVDDVLSSLGSAVAEAIFANVFGPQGLMNGAIRIIVTNEASLMARCDKVIQIGSHHGIATIVSVEDGQAATPSLTSPPLRVAAMGEESPTILADADADEPAQGKLRVVRILIEMMGGYLSVLLLFLAIFATDLVRLIGDDILKRRMAALGGSAKTFSRHYFALGSLHGILSVLSNIYVVRLCVRASHRLHNDSLQRIVGARMSVLSGMPSGRLLNRLGRDLETLDYALPEKLICVMGSISTLLCTMLTVARILPHHLFYTILLPVVLMVLLQRRFAVAWRILLRVTSQTMGPVTAILSETYAGLPTIGVFRRRHLFLARLRQHIDGFTVSSFLSVGVRRWSSLRCEMVASLYLAILGAYSITKRLNASSAGMLFLYALEAAERMDLFIKQLAELDHSLISVERLALFSQQLPLDWHSRSGHPDESKTPGNLQHVHTRETPAPPSTSRLDLKFCKVTIRHSVATASPDLASEAVVRIDELHIPQGTKVAVQGRTGAGKSSLLAAILGFCPYDGLITLADMDIRQFPHLRSQIIASVLQETALFDATIRENLVAGSSGPIDEMRLWSVLDLVEMRPFVSALPLALDSSLGPQTLSAGQQQLLCLARALLRFPADAQVLLLDEATANLEPSLEMTIHRRLLQWVGPHVTVLSVTHRPKVASLYERQLVFVDGVILDSSM